MLNDRYACGMCQCFQHIGEFILLCSEYFCFCYAHFNRNITIFIKPRHSIFNISTRYQSLLTASFIKLASILSSELFMCYKFILLSILTTTLIAVFISTFTKPGKEMVILEIKHQA